MEAIRGSITSTADFLSPPEDGPGDHRRAQLVAAVVPHQQCDSGHHQRHIRKLVREAEIAGFDESRDSRRHCKRSAARCPIDKSYVFWPKMRSTKVLQHIAHVSYAAWLCDGIQCATAMAAISHVWQFKGMTGYEFRCALLTDANRCFYKEPSQAISQ